MIVYFNGQFVSKAEVCISPDDRGFLFGDGVYEVIATYGGRLFRAEEHFNRLERSLAQIRIEYGDIESLCGVVKELFSVNGFKRRDGLAYIQITRGAAERKHAFPNAVISPTVYAYVYEFNRSKQKIENGVKVITVPDIRWGRCDIKSTALLPNVLANQRAQEQGAEDALFVLDDRVTEASHSSFFAVLDHKLHTHPNGRRILPSINRDVAIELATRLGVEVLERPINLEELAAASECFLTGTGSELLPVVQVDDGQVGNGKPGAVFKRLQAAFVQLTRGAISSP